MEQITRQYWEKCFEVEFIGRKGTEFQNFFTRIMELRYPSDFTQVKPWGRDGDQKCDGWLASERRLFQVYAPEDMKKSETETKMESDFNGAQKHWGGKFDHWTFVHNSRSGVPAFVLKKTIEFKVTYPGIGFTPWGYAEIRQRLFALQSEDIAVILGPALSPSAMQSVRFSDIAAVLRHVEATDAPSGADLRPVPADKLATNSLSSDVAAFLKLGMLKARLVAQFFNQHHDPRFGDALAYSFNKRYLELRHAGLPPDDIFWELRAYAGVNDAKSDHEQAAALAVLAHLFEECDIFERVGSALDARGES